MRQGQNPKRPRGRNSGRHNVPSRHQTFDSNGPSIRVRGNAHQVYEKYLTMARDAHVSGDRIMAENYHQHADHYFRILNSEPDENRSSGQPQRNGNGVTPHVTPNSDASPTQDEAETDVAQPVSADEDAEPDSNV